MEAPPPPTTCWSNVVKKEAPSQNHHHPPAADASRVVGSCKSSKGVAVAVVDTNAIIEGSERLAAVADKFVSVSEVMAEVRDPASRHRLAFLPFTVDIMEPSPESLKKVINFARATGDLHTLSDVDLKVIALAHTLEAQIHGTQHLKDIPPPVHVVNVKRLPEKDMPGWGSNVPNLEEWEALEREVEDRSNTSSRILPLKDISLNIVPTDAHVSSGDGLVGNEGEGHAEDQEDSGSHFRKPRRYLPKKKEINIEGKKMVADGIDASQGQYDDNASDWLPAVGRSTHRRYLRRKARREMCEALFEKDSEQDREKNMENNILDETKCQEQLLHASSEEAHVVNGISEEREIQDGKNGDDLSSILKQMRLEEDSKNALQEGEQSTCHEELESSNSSAVKVNVDNHATAVERDDAEMVINEDMDQLEISSQTNESAAASYVDDDSSEQSWTLRSLSDSSVACITSDFAMQNVILQMGLRLLAPGGLQIHQLHRWILKCHACYKVTAETRRIFCPACGNGGTLRKVAVTVGENGVVLSARRPRITLRGTKFSLPLPQGGRDAITKNPVLREDQLPSKFLHPRTKKKANKQEDDFSTLDDIFSHHTDKKAPLKPPVGRALAVFSGKRNPNDNHFSRKKH
ncbi:RNA-binding NOB1-like protein [Malania oleifera]|uniref:RNA-binding NOB1-like protein n=1 Tax=Malania oleifera TaxID=397392 RepID=UPI0025ADD8FF|nr:RNA-binding NOB1-like protein [Malania oleifera]